MKYISSLAQVIIKLRHILSFNFECLGMGLILFQIQKQSFYKNIVVFHHRVNLNNFNIKFQKDSIMVRVI